MISVGSGYEVVPKFLVTGSGGIVTWYVRVRGGGSSGLIDFYRGVVITRN